MRAPECRRLALGSHCRWIYIGLWQVDRQELVACVEVGWQPTSIVDATTSAARGMAQTAGHGSNAEELGTFTWFELPIGSSHPQVPSCSALWPRAAVSHITDSVTSAIFVGCETSSTRRYDFLRPVCIGKSSYPARDEGSRSVSTIAPFGTVAIACASTTASPVARGGQMPPQPCIDAYAIEEGEAVEAAVDAPQTQKRQQEHGRVRCDPAEPTTRDPLQFLRCVWDPCEEESRRCSRCATGLCSSRL